MCKNVIETFGLTRHFGKTLAVDQLDLAVPAGSIYGFLGPNGAGKTTTIRMLLGLIRPSAGNLQIFGGPLNEDRRRRLRRIGSLVETPSFYPNLTGRENLELICRLRGDPRGDVGRALEIVDLTSDADRLSGHYSLGMGQRLGLAIALLGQPELLILDEPTNGLDPAGICEMRALLARLAREQGLTVFVSSHLLAEVEQIATHIGILQAGRLVFQGTAAELHARFSDQLAVQVDRLEDARWLLKRAGFQPVHNHNHTLTLPAGNPEEAAQLNGLLVQAGIQVYQLKRSHPSLEEIFLNLTGSPSAERMLA